MVSFKRSVSALILFCKRNSADIAVVCLLLCACYYIAYLYRLRATGPIPVGYDPGMYVRMGSSYIDIMQKYGREFFLHFGELWGGVKNHEPGRGMLSMLFSFFSVQPEQLLYGRWFFFAHRALLPMAYIVYAITKSKKSVLLFVLMALLSIVHYQAFVLMYYKQLIALGFGFLGYIGLYTIVSKDRFSWIWLISLVGLVLFHRHTALFFVVSYAIRAIVYMIVYKKIAKKMLMLFVAGMVLGSLRYVPLAYRTIVPYFSQIADVGYGDAMGGYFLSLYEYVRLDIFYIIFSIVFLLLSLYGLLYQSKKTHPYVDMLSYSTLLSILRLVFHMINYKRHIVFLSALSIILAACGIFLLWSYRNKFLSLGLIVAIFLQYLYRQGYYDLARVYFIDQDTLQDIRQVSNYIPISGTVFLSSSAWTPWIIGYGSIQRQISPGLSDDNVWNYSEWTKRWGSNPSDRCDLLYKSYGDYDLYARVHQSEGNPIYLKSTCYKLIYTGKVSSIYHIEYNK